jgi:hypothetical protein
MMAFGLAWLASTQPAVAWRQGQEEFFKASLPEDSGLVGFQSKSTTRFFLYFSRRQLLNSVTRLPVTC